MAPHFHMVDVFGTGPVSGNPLAVVAAAGKLEVEEMQRIATWFNLSETTFLVPPTRAEADYRVRIFTLNQELPFAGHPTLGTCHAWLAGGGVPKNQEEIIQECVAGLVPIRRGQGRLAFAAPPLIRTGAPAAEELAEARRLLGLEPGEVVDAAWVDNGPGWLGIKLASAERVLALQPAPSWPRPMDVGVVGPYAEGSEAAFELRAFFTDPRGTILEDPVTGSLNASMAQWLFASGDARGAYVASQGTCLGRRGRIHVSRDPDGRIWIGGTTRTQVEGQFVGMG